MGFSARRLWPLLYPPLFAAALVLGVAAQSAGQYGSSDLAKVLAAVTVATAFVVAVVFAVVGALERSDRSAPLAAGLAMLPVAWCFYYLPVRSALPAVSHHLSEDRVLVPLGLAMTLGAAAWLLRQSRGRLLGVSAFMGRFGLLLVALVSVRVVVSHAREPQMAKRSALVRELARPLRTLGAPPPGRNTPSRDIYLIVLDGHANARVLRQVFKFDNSPFEDSLRALGFLVPRDMRSNYVQTYLSVASLLNASQLTQLSQDAGLTSMDHSLPTYLVKNNRAARFLKAHGYKYVLFPSAWWAATANSPLADEEFDPHPDLGLVQEVRRTEFRLAVLRSTLLRYALRTDRAPVPLVQHFLRSFEGLGEVSDDPAPTFAFAHILLPHIPYVVDGDCQLLKPAIPDDQEADTPEQRADYVDQVRCVDHLVLDLVTRLLRRSSTPPIILVVGDHGSRFADIGFYGHPDSVPTAFIRERFGAFGAFYLPAGGDSVFREPVTLVNVLGNVLRYYFNADLPPSPDEMYVSGQHLYHFYRVDPRRYAGQDGAPTPDEPRLPEAHR